MSVKKSIFVRLHAKPGKEEQLAGFLAGALPLANAEAQTVHWFALRFDAHTFGVFDTFADDAGRDAHLHGQIAAALMKHAEELLSEAPKIEKVGICWPPKARSHLTIFALPFPCRDPT